MNMNKLSRLLPAFALVLAAMFAMAMNIAQNPTERYAEDTSSGPEIWYDLTDITPGVSTYQCDELVSTTCSRVEPMTSANQVETGEFIKNGNLPVVEP